MRVFCCTEALHKGNTLLNAQNGYAHLSQNGCRMGSPKETRVKAILGLEERGFPPKAPPHYAQNNTDSNFYRPFANPLEHLFPYLFHRSRSRQRFPRKSAEVWSAFVNRKDSPPLRTFPSTTPNPENPQSVVANTRFRKIRRW